MTNVVIVKSALQNSTTTSGTLRQEKGMFVARPVSTRMTTLAAAWMVSTAAITSAFLDNAAQRDNETLESPATKLGTGVAHNVVLSNEPQFCVEYSDGLIGVWRLRGDHLLSASFRYKHSSPCIWCIGLGNHCINDKNIYSSGRR
ncbi:hypothetical protein TNCV_2719841 [Trichonephila clavipes]|nr:hypothetical protein TNCV_2719841 [Trichonephila clavipes]